MKQQLLLSYYSHLRRLYRSTLQKPTKKSLSLAQALVFVMPYRGFVRSSSQGPPHLFKNLVFREKKRDSGGDCSSSCILSAGGIVYTGRRVS